MIEDKKPAENEEYLKKVVQAWVDNNPAEFKDDCKLLYRKKVFDRCRKYIGAPKEYLETMLNTLPEFMKWYLSVFETVFMAGTVGLVSALAVISLNNAITSFQQWVGWVLPLVLAVAIAAAVTSKPLRFSHFIQNRFYVRHNLNESNIELYYISLVMKIREERDKNLDNDSEKKRSKP